MDDLEVVGLGMNGHELQANPILSSYHTIDLNANPTLPSSLVSPSVPSPSSSSSSTPRSPRLFSAATCALSIDYLIHPLPLLSSLRALLAPGARVHLVLSNRCFPTKVIGRWLRVSEDERVRMVGDYLHFSGWGEVEVVEVVKADDAGFKGAGDPLWVVRGTKREGEEDGESRGAAGGVDGVGARGP
jgi:hypothetical protein